LLENRHNEEKVLTGFNGTMIPRLARPNRNFAAALIFFCLITQIHAQDFFGDQYKKLADNYQNQTRSELLKFGAALDDERSKMKEDLKYLLEPIFDIEFACKSAPSQSEPVSREIERIFLQLERSTDRMSTKAESVLSRISEKKESSEARFQRNCPAPEGNFNAFIECIDLQRKHYVQVALAAQASAVQHLRVNGFVQRIPLIKQCVLQKNNIPLENLRKLADFTEKSAIESMKLLDRINGVSTDLL